MGEGGRYQRAYVGQFIAFGVLLLVVAFLAPFLLLRLGAAPVVAVVGCLVPLLVALRLIRLMVAGGVEVHATEVSIRGWFRHETIPTSTVRAVHVRRDGAGEPAGWLAVGDHDVFLRGMTARHRHSVVLGSGPDGQVPTCDQCAETNADLAQLAERLGVPLIDLGARRGSIAGFW
jgi:xanthosine utilization system XapX-like protein